MGTPAITRELLVVMLTTEEVFPLHGPVTQISESVCQQSGFTWTQSMHLHPASKLVQTWGRHRPHLLLASHLIPTALSRDDTFSDGYSASDKSHRVGAQPQFTLGSPCCYFSWFRPQKIMMFGGHCLPYTLTVTFQLFLMHCHCCKTCWQHY